MFLMSSVGIAQNMRIMWTGMETNRFCVNSVPVSLALWC